RERAREREMWCEDMIIMRQFDGNLTTGAGRQSLAVVACATRIFCLRRRHQQPTAECCTRTLFMPNARRKRLTRHFHSYSVTHPLLYSFKKPTANTCNITLA